MNRTWRDALKHTVSWRDNPLLTGLRGLSPVLAVSFTALNGIALGAATLLVLATATLFMHPLRHRLTPTWRIGAGLLVLALLASLLELLVQWWHPRLREELGVYLPLICCNAAVLAELEIRREECSLGSALAGALATGGGFLLAITLFAGLRELIIRVGLMLPAPVADGTAGFLTLPAAAFLLLGLLLASWQYLNPDDDPRSLPTRGSEPP